MRSEFIAWGLLMLIVLTTASCSSKVYPTFPERVFSNPWSMDAQGIEHLREAVNALNMGDKVERVVENVGVPDSDHTTNKNERVGIFTYYVIRLRADSPIESDRIVLIAFDRRDKVRAIYSNVTGVLIRNWAGYPNSFK